MYHQQFCPSAGCLVDLLATISFLIALNIVQRVYSGFQFFRRLRFSTLPLAWFTLGITILLTNLITGGFQGQSGPHVILRLYILLSKTVYVIMLLRYKGQEQFHSILSQTCHRLNQCRVTLIESVTYLSITSFLSFLEFLQQSELSHEF